MLLKYINDKVKADEINKKKENISGFIHRYTRHNFMLMHRTMKRD